MTVFKHEMRQGKISLIIWTGAIAFLFLTCVLIYPEMRGSVDELNEMFASMGNFTQAFGMDKVNIGEFMGFYAVECGEILGLGGGIFAAMLGVASLSKEEKGRTAEFLLTHPVSRVSVAVQKLLACMVQIVIMNAAIFAVTAVSAIAIGEEPDFKVLALFHLAHVFLQIELAAVTFGISAFLRGGAIGIGIGVAALMYFLSLVSNMVESAECLKYITPFGYTDGAQIVSDGALEWELIAIGAVYSAAAIICGLIKYTKKDIA